MPRMPSILDKIDRRWLILGLIALGAVFIIEYVPAFDQVIPYHQTKEWISYLMFAGGVFIALSIKGGGGTLLEGGRYEIVQIRNVKFKDQKEPTKLYQPIESRNVSSRRDIDAIMYDYEVKWVRDKNLRLIQLLPLPVPSYHTDMRRR